MNLFSSYQHSDFFYILETQFGIFFWDRWEPMGQFYQSVSADHRRQRSCGRLHQSSSSGVSHFELLGASDNIDQNRQHGGVDHLNVDSLDLFLCGMKSP